VKALTGRGSKTPRISALDVGAALTSVSGRFSKGKTSPRYSGESEQALKPVWESYRGEGGGNPVLKPEIKTIT
jgi:hypothetical protein